MPELGEFAEPAVPEGKHFRSPALDGAIGTRWVELLMAVQTHWIQHEAADGVDRVCALCRVYTRNWWD